MRRRLLAATGAALAVAGAAAATAVTSAASAGGPATATWPHAAASAGATASPDITGARTLRLIAHTERGRVIKAGRHFGPGSYLVFEESLQNAQTGRMVGMDSVRCTANFTTFMCDGTALLGGADKIMIYGATTEHGPQVYAVTGGTGNYRNVRGQMQVRDLGRNTTELTFRLLP